MPLIVLEGADGCGKSYLALELMRQMPKSHYVHATYRFKKAMTLYHTAIIEQNIARLRAGGTVIIDRWWPSEMMYGKVYRNQHEPLENLRMIHRLGLRHGATYVLCHRGSRESQMEEFAKLKAKRVEMYEADARIGFLHDGYQNLWDVSSRGQEARWIKYNVDSAMVRRSYFEFMVKTILECARHYDNMRQQNDIVLKHSTGNFFAKYVMVGERTNPTYHRLDYPWIGFRGSSVSVTQSLKELAVPEHNFFWTNAQGPGNHETELTAFLKSTPRDTKVVAMGEIARKFCENAGRCDIAMNHPAYITRFHSQKSLTTTLGKVLAC
jgi:thymidylate kinase